MEGKENAKAIREALNARISNLAIRIGPETTQGYIEIRNAAHAYGTFTQDQIDALHELGICPQQSVALIAPGKPQYWLGLILA